MAEYTELKNVNNTQAQTLSNVLLENFVSFYDWGFLNKGGYYNISIPQSGAYGGDDSTLHAIKTANYSQGKVWQATRGNWVWENDVTYSSGSNNPTSISGVWVDGSFQNTGHSIDHQNGRVIFDTAVDIASNVQINHSQKWLKVIPAKGIPWVRDIQRGMRNFKDLSIENYGSGNWARLGQTKVNLPVLTVDVKPSKNLRPLQLGGGQWANNDIMFSVIAETDWECKNILDTVIAQNERTIFMYDSDAVIASGNSLHNYDNSLTTWGAASGHYPSLVDNYRHPSRCFIYDSVGSDIMEMQKDLYIGTAKCTTEVILPTNKAL